MVNRMWQHLFGVGLVETADNFGHSGTPPTHPKLLEWLAQAWIDGGYRWKPMLKSIMLSTAYRQASAVAADSRGTEAVDLQQVDPANHLLSRQRLRRLESEAVRDRLLAVSGDLDRTLYGPPAMLESKPDGSVVVKSTDPAAELGSLRRSIYVLAQAQLPLVDAGSFRPARNRDQLHAAQFFCRGFAIAGDAERRFCAGCVAEIRQANCR